VESLYTVLGIRSEDERNTRTILTKQIETNDENSGLDVGIGAVEARTALTASVETIDNDRKASFLLASAPGSGPAVMRTVETRQRETVDNDQEAGLHGGHWGTH
jgi:hypothetical protein